MILEADVIRVTEGSIHTTISPNLRSWNIAESLMTWQGDVSPAGSKTAACYQTETLGFSGGPVCSPYSSRSMWCQAYERQDIANGILGVGSVHSTDETG